MHYETLYKRAKTGKPVYWKIEVDGSTIVKLAGEIGTTKPKRHEEHISVGKQNRTQIQQAESQALSDWKKKHDEGYKTLTDLGIGHIVECVPGSDAHTQKVSDDNVYKVLDNALPKFNTDASGNVKPMLAKPVDWNKITYPCLVQPKLDGVRCLMISSLNENGSPSTIFLSRSGKEYITLNHIRTDVDAYQYSWMPGEFILDGEIYSDELTFQEITQAVKKQYPNSLKLKFRAYDIVSSLSQKLRDGQFGKLVVDIDSPFVQIVDTMVANVKEDIKQWHDTWVQQGYEGAMIRLHDGMYDQGQRSSSLLKVKEFDENEFAFKNFEFGQRGVEDLIAVLWDLSGKQEFRAKMVGKKKYKEELYEQFKDGSGEGKSMTIKHFGYTDDKLPRFPIGKGFRLKEDTD